MKITEGQQWPSYQNESFVIIATERKENEEEGEEEEEERRGSLIRKRGGVEAVAGRQATGAGSRTKGCLLP